MRLLTRASCVVLERCRSETQDIFPDYFSSFTSASTFYMFCLSAFTSVSRYLKLLSNQLGCCHFRSSDKLGSASGSSKLRARVAPLAQMRLAQSSKSELTTAPAWIAPHTASFITQSVRLYCVVHNTRVRAVRAIEALFPRFISGKHPTCDL